MSTDASPAREDVTIHGHCRACGYTVISVCCNVGEWEKLDPQEETWDWWMYCTNKTCVHHVGEGYFQTDPSYLIRNVRTT